MNKYKKLAMSAISLVMAGGMMLSFAACDGTTDPGKDPGKDPGQTVDPGKDPDNNGGNTDVNIPSFDKDGLPDDNPNAGKPNATTGEHAQAKLTPKLDANGKLTTASTTTVRMDIGDKPARSVAFDSKMISGSIKLIDGKDYTGGTLKPAWAAAQKELGFQIQSKYSVDSNKYTTTYANDPTYSELFTDTVATITTKAQENPNLFLDLGNYLEYMPNYSAFLNANQASYMSFVSDTTTGAMYYAPYYDGNDDIEKYVIAKTNWVSALLDSTTTADTTTLKAQAEAKGLTLTKASAKSFMGTTGKWAVMTTTSDGKSTTKLIVNYDAALAEAKDEAKPLGAALKAAGVADLSTLTSGNIVDLQNAAIDAKDGAVTGGQLLAILQAYVDVAYQKEDGSKFYAKRSDVFNGYDAGWDADLMTAYYRCVVTNPSLLKSGKTGHVGDDKATALKDVYGLTSRQNNMQRQSDIYAFAGELYGVRGLESRYEFSYIDGEGKLQDARQQTATYDAMDKMHNLVSEGLINIGAATANQTSYYDGKSIEAAMLYDYVNTQTPTGFQLMEGTGVTSYDLEDDYYFTPIVTPVSTWNDGRATRKMRFTESWRSVKNSGFAIPLDSVKNDPDKLSAVLMFVDYLFSEDGQLAMSYGPKADDKTGTNGIWYNEVATAAQEAAGQYFTYKGVKYYSETFYAGKYQPTLTDNAIAAYLGKTVNGVTYTGGEGAGGWSKDSACVRNYTNFARYVVGSALAIGNKLQSFEYQCTSDMGKYGASVVDTSLNNHTIQHPYVTIESLKEGIGAKHYNLWYLICPSALPLTQAEAADNSSASDITGTLFTGESKKDTNYLWEIIKNGYDTSIAVMTGCNLGSNAIECVLSLTDYNLPKYVENKQAAFGRIKTYFNLG